VLRAPLNSGVRHQVKQLAWRIAVFCLLALVTSNAALYGRGGWFEAFVSNRTFVEPFGWLDAGSLIMWAFELLLFFALGVVVSGLFRAYRPSLWALTFGAICGVLHFLPSQHWFAHDAPRSAYFWLYGVYFIPAFGAWLGSRVSWCLTIHSSGRSSAKAASRR